MDGYELSNNKQFGQLIEFPRNHYMVRRTVAFFFENGYHTENDAFHCGRPQVGTHVHCTQGGWRPSHCGDGLISHPLACATHSHAVVLVSIVCTAREMSLFKSREWWSTYAGDDGEQFGAGCLCIFNIVETNGCNIYI